MTSVPRIAALLATGVIAGSVLVGCGHEGRTASIPPEPPAASPADLARQGLYDSAAEAWLAEAASAPEGVAAVLRLRAAEAWWKAGPTPSEPAKPARAIDPAELAPDAVSRRTLLLARAALADGAGRDGFDALPPLEDLLALPEPTAALELAVRAARKANRAVDEIRFRIAFDPELADPAANREALWNLIRVLPGESLRDPPVRTLIGSGEQAAGWFRLGQLARVHGADFPAFSAAIRSWRERYPDHPADTAILPRLLDRIRREDSPSSRVALLLPLSGTFASAAAAVRDGFLAGWYTEGADRPVVSIYDTGAEEPGELFRTAIADGADFVVGPLSKKAITRIASLTDRAAPVLLLNALDGDVVRATGGPALYQFALSPEDEARAVAAFARRNGHARAGILVPETEWGARVADAFVEQWEASGAVVVGRSTYRGAAEDLAQPVRELLGIDVSEARARRLRRVLRHAVAHEPSPRGDLDFVFLVGFPREARLLRPQIIFLRAPDLPVYATSHVFTGVPESQHDLDLEGIVFNDMPWVLNQSSGNDALRERIVALWPAASEGFTRYYAFGVDTYRLQRRIHHLAAHPGEAVLLGRTGRLTVGPDARVRIEMAWARFENGEPGLLSP